MHIHITNANNLYKWSAAKLGQNETLNILKSFDLTEMPIYLYDDSNESWNEKSARFDGLISGLHQGDIVFFQYPTWNAIEWDSALIDRLLLYGAKVVLFIHDVMPLQFENSYYLMPKFIQTANKAELVIVPSKQMYNRLVQEGLTVKKYVIQKLWDFNVDIDLHTPSFEKRLYFTGDISRFPFIQDWKYSTPLYCYGNKMDGYDYSKVHFGGWLNKTELLLELSKDGFGLVWGNSEDPKDERDYYKMNCSYKLSSYLSAGIPVIVPSYLSNSDFVKDSNIGFVVNSLEEANRVVQECNEERYKEMVSNLKQVQFLINNGYFTKKLFIDAIMLLNS